MTEHAAARLLQDAANSGGQPRQSTGRLWLADAIEVGRTRAAHATYFVQLAERAEPEINGPDQAEWFARLELELDNLRAAVAELLRANRIDDELRLVSALVDLWLTRGNWSEAVGWLRMGLSIGSEVSDRAQAAALARQGMLATTLGDLADGTRLLEEGLALAREIGDTAGPLGQ